MFPPRKWGKTFTAFNILSIHPFNHLLALFYYSGHLDAEHILFF
jgi:hypothetical protein